MEVFLPEHLAIRLSTWEAAYSNFSKEFVSLLLEI